MELDCGKCKIRSWRLEDGQSLVCHANNLKVWRNLRDRFPHPYTPDEAQKWLAQTVSADPEVDFSVVFGGEAVGGIGFTLGSDVERHSAEVGYWLGEGFWGRGIATAAGSLASGACMQFRSATILARYGCWRKLVS
jgi:ribosomal-protein-alanine N-acetyltransferase